VYAASHPFALLLAEVVKRLGSVVRVPGVGMVVNDPVVAQRVLTDRRAFSVESEGGAGALYTQILGPVALLNMEGEDHARLHRLFAAVMAPAYLREAEDGVVAPLTLRLGEDLKAGRRVDMVRFSRNMAGRSVCHMLGLPYDELSDEEVLAMFGHAEEMISGVGLRTKHISPKQVVRAKASFEQLVSGVDAAFRSGKVRPGSFLAKAAQEGLDPETTRALSAIFLLTGTHTLGTAIPRIAAMLIDSGELDTLREDPSSLQRVIDDGLRCVAPSPVLLRVALEECELLGKRVRRGERIVVLLYNALKDSGHYPHPRSIDPSRVTDPALQNLVFGGGAHYCIGVPLARLELSHTLRTLAAVPGGLAIVRRQPARGVTIPAYASLEVAARGPARHR
jgi:cytochrome P450